MNDIVENERAIKLYIVTTLQAVEDVSNAALKASHKVLETFMMSPTSPSEIPKYAISILHSKEYQKHGMISGNVEFNPMMAVMSEEDQALAFNNRYDY